MNPNCKLCGEDEATKPDPVSEQIELCEYCYHHCECGAELPDGWEGNTFCPRCN